MKLQIKSLASQNAVGKNAFLVIQEEEFPSIFQDPILKKQKLKDYNDEIDYNSDKELIAKNKKQLLKSLTNSIDRYVTGNPLQLIENIKLTRELDLIESGQKSK